MENLWEQVGNLCLQNALALLKKGTTPTAATVEMVKDLTTIAIAIDDLNRRWEQQNQSCAAVFQGPSFGRTTTESSTGRRVEQG